MQYWRTAYGNSGARPRSALFIVPPLALSRYVVTLQISSSDFGFPVVVCVLHHGGRSCALRVSMRSNSTYRPTPLGTAGAPIDRCVQLARFFPRHDTVGDDGQRPAPRAACVSTVEPSSDEEMSRRSCGRPCPTVCLLEIGIHRTMERSLEWSTA